ncbi:D-alanyl-D-alanine carboxypeptidase family protein [Sinanaerobacter chloroacetimidivorans]|uniref:serine-type D-Ala-D-Ala carboxypeptidase n=1 Tax=Sinanaerobacter chloroacetimidivorans TaxID=2818044 RepID=A0A8J7W3T9_9FIRM|nr:D-alanyl-D-alanine carboxypeptidase family protein [Sinanaerobacter chloroacetimidivorans]MBR0600004.1 D-alanyl-D-alanine carboxypeptidase [Sinanaerobacter chloroacetimidivorans]
MYYLRKIAIGLVVFMCMAMVPWAVCAEEEETVSVLSSAVDTEGTVLPSSVTGGAIGMTVDAKSAILIDAESGTVLFEQNSHDRLPPASVTKVMTMLLIMEAVDRGQISLQDKVTISEKAASMGGSQMYMEPGEQHELETLMKGIAIASANDACVSAAEFHSGTVDIFVENMNKRAAELGMKDTNFVNTNGLPVANHYTSAYDIALMSKELYKHKKTQEWFNTWMTNITVGLPGKKQTELGLTNTNRMIKIYPGANGIKTGFTQEAGYCLSASATKGDLTLIAVIMGSPASNVRFAETSKMLDYGFANYDAVKLAEKGEPMGTVMIEKGSPNMVNAVTPENISILVKKGEKDGIRGDLVFDDSIYAPIAKGDQIGEIIVYKNDQEMGRYPVVAEENVEKASLLELYIRMIKSLT